ncbi:hypothetical protein DFH11DRAFT_1740699 [Phellopilus nigrolimitatus]|nr:hypothetical protein DFH11DRAFT_1740699 [Phellopilus nigrolimitatus]
MYVMRNNRNTVSPSLLLQGFEEHSLVDKGERGEIVARLIFNLAYDEAPDTYEDTSESRKNPLDENLTGFPFYSKGHSLGKNMQNMSSEATPTMSEMDRLSGRRSSAPGSGQMGTDIFIPVILRDEEHCDKKVYMTLLSSRKNICGKPRSMFDFVSINENDSTAECLHGNIYGPKKRKVLPGNGTFLTAFYSCTVDPCLFALENVNNWW